MDRRSVEKIVFLARFQHSELRGPVAHEVEDQAPDEGADRGNAAPREGVEGRAKGRRDGYAGGCQGPDRGVIRLLGVRVDLHELLPDDAPDRRRDRSQAFNLMEILAALEGYENPDAAASALFAMDDLEQEELIERYRNAVGYLLLEEEVRSGEYQGVGYYAAAR